MSEIQLSLTSSEVATILGFSIGFLWGEAFSKFDHVIKYQSKKYQGLAPLKQWFVSSLMDATHHFQYGLTIVLAVLTAPLFSEHPILKLILLYLGLGLIVSDWKDYQNILKRMGLGTKNEERKLLHQI